MGKWREPSVSRIRWGKSRIQTEIPAWFAKVLGKSQVGNVDEDGV